MPRAGTRRGGLLPDTLARRLDARFVLHGSICRAKNQLRVTARLFDARTGRNLWAETYQREGAAEQPLAAAGSSCG